MDGNNIEKIRKILLDTNETKEKTLDLLNLIGNCIKDLPLNEQQEFTTLWFFADWTQQTVIGKSLPALMLIKKLNNRLDELKDVKSNELFMKQLTDTFSFSILQNEMQKFLKKYGLPADIVVFPYHFKRFKDFLINLLVNRPLSFPNPKNKGMKKLLNKALKKQVENRKGIISFYISFVDEALVEGAAKPSGKNVAALTMLTHNGGKIVIPLN